MPIATHLHSVGRRACALAFAGAAALALAACQQTPPPSNATPEKAVATNLRLIATGDFDGLMKNRLPPDDYAQWRAEWDKAHAQPLPASVAQEQQFAQIMQMLTAKDAEAKLAKRLQPTLANMRGGKQSGLPILGGILEAAGQQMIADTPQLGDAQRTLAAQALAAMVAWTQATDFGDPKRARKAIDLMCATARSLHVQTLAQWRALDYATTMKDYGIVWNALEKILQIYDLDVAHSLLDAKIAAATNDGARATVNLQMELAGKPLTGAWPMLKRNNHWYDVAMLDAWQAAHPAPAAGDSTAAPAANAPAASGSSATSPAKAASAGRGSGHS